MKLDANSNVLITGTFSLTVDFDPGPGTFNMTSTSTRNAYVLKLDNNGNFIFSKQFTGNSFGQSIAVDQSNNIYIAGGFSGPSDFDPGPGTSIVNGGNIFITTLDPLGNFIWVATFQNAIVGSYESIYVSIQVDALKNVYYAGILPFAVDYDPGPGTFIATPLGINDMPIVKLNGQCRTNSTTLQVTTCDRYTLNGITYTSSGSFVQTLAGSGGCDSLVTLNLTLTQILTQVSQSACGSYNWNGNVYSLSGSYRDTLTAVNGCDSIVTLTLIIKELPNPQLGSDIFICPNESQAIFPGVFDSYSWNDASANDSLLVNQPGIYWVTVSANGCTARDSIQVFPKTGCPNNNECLLSSSTLFYPIPCGNEIYLQKEQTNCMVYLNLYNELGQLVMKNKLVADGINNIDLKQFPAGTYFYKLHTMQNILKRGKIVKGHL